MLQVETNPVDMLGLPLTYPTHLIPKEHIRHHFSANYGLLKDASDYVSRWSSSVNNYALSQVTAASQPKWQDDGAGANCIKFDGSNDFLSGVQPLYYSGLTMTICFKYHTWGAYSTLMSSGNLFGCDGTQSSPRWTLQHNTIIMHGGVSTIEIAADTKFVVTFSVPGQGWCAPNSDVDFGYQGIVNYNATEKKWYCSCGPLFAGALQLGMYGGSYPLDASIYEFYMADTVLSCKDQRALHAWMRAKHGV